MKSVKFFIKRLKMKFYYSPENYKSSNTPTEVEKAVNALSKHYNIEQQDVVTSEGIGNIYTPITHHSNEYVNPKIVGKHLIGDHLDKNSAHFDHPDNKTGTLSNTSYYVDKNYLESDDPNTKIEFSERPSILKRIDNENFIDHYRAYINNKNNKVFNLIDGSEVEVHNDHTIQETPTEIIKDDNSITVYTNTDI